MNRHNRYRLAIELVLIVSSVFGMLIARAEAQDAGDIARDQTTIIEQFEPPPRRAPSIGITFANPVAGLPVEKLKAIRFQLRGVKLEGAMTLDPSIFAPLWKDLIGRKISLADLKTVVDGIERIYREHDYFGAALVPQQDFSKGQIRIVLYEAHILDIVVESNRPELKEKLQPYFDRMMAMRPVRVSRLERYALLIADIPGVTVEAQFSKIEDDPGAGRLVLKIDYEPFGFAARLDNLGTPATGPLQLSGIARFNDTLGLLEGSEALAVTNPVDPEELVFLRFGQLFPLGPSGFAAGYEVGHVWTNPQDDDDIDVETTFGKIYLRYALVRAIDHNLFVNFAINTKDVAVDVNGDPAVRASNRWLTATGTFDTTVAGIAVVAEAGLGQGIGGLGSNTENADFTYVFGEGTLSHNVTESLSAQLQITGQYGLTELPSAVRFDVGGDPYGRGFDGGSITGDDGIAAAFELRQKIDTQMEWLNDLSLFGFVDYAAVWNPPGRDYEFASLGSVGAGFRAEIGNRFNLMAYVATPYKDEAKLGIESTQFRLAAGVRF
ncbi:ShlB/FhaC/HecB family hemolysin secretion/activation protein [Mesorhizobium sp. LjRoot246]|uniref:ShlB/FhaC/HecB family hemolysin secretion/activation protein n=1 Tax=Mesorhizobium sp. LjRoot246 TaxID=3342294 RepID=UPI003ECDADFC